MIQFLPRPGIARATTPLSEYPIGLELMRLPSECVGDLVRAHSTMASGWEFSGAPASVGDVVTLVEGSSFCVSDAAGRMRSGLPQGVFYMDTRIFGTWSVTVDGEDVEPLAVFIRQPHHATFLGRAGPAARAWKARCWCVGSGTSEPGCARTSWCATWPRSQRASQSRSPWTADFADLFAVKEGRARPHSATETRAVDGLLALESTLSDVRRGVRVQADGALTVPGKLIFREVVPPRGEWRTTRAGAADDRGRRGAREVPG